MQERNITTLVELARISESVLIDLSAKEHSHVIGLVGDLGAGKTAFTKVLARRLSVAEEVTSPTFVIMKSYNIPDHTKYKTLTHVDAYRIESEEEMHALHFEELLRDEAQLICIEWPEKIKNMLPEDMYTIQFTLNHDGSRDITYGE